MTDSSEETDALLITEAILGYAVVLGDRGDLAEAAWQRLQVRLNNAEEAYRYKRREAETLGRALEEVDAELAEVRRLKEAVHRINDGTSTQLADALLRIEQFERALRRAEPVLEHVSRGKGFAFVDPYPDAEARAANFLVKEALYEPRDVDA